MKKNLYTRVSSFLLLAVFYLLPFFGHAQTCTGLAVTCTASESRCMATGTITVRAGGGSGNYNYKAIGPVTTNFTSSSFITGLQPGVYKVIVRDITRNCQVEKDSVVVNGTYSDPRFLLTKTDVTCAGNNGTITATSQQFGRAPFSYTIVAPSPAGVGTTNTTGFFTNLIAGAYAVQLRDSCGGIQVRRITLQGYSWWFDGVTVTKTDCNNATALIRLKNNKGELNTSSTAFSGFGYGMVNTPGDTTWMATNSFSFFTGSKRAITFVAKDACGTIHTYTWTVPANTKPSVAAIGISNTTCTQFTASVNGGQNLTAPQYTLFDNTNTAVQSNATGVFDNLSYGNYCIRIKDACYDTTIIKCFTAAQPAPSVAATVATSDFTCTNFTASITGQANLFNPSYCLYDNRNILQSCNSTGVFTGLVYGSYCIKITDGCTNTVINRCVTATKPAPVLRNVAITGQNCTRFDATANGTNLVNPTYCLYDALGNVVTCNTTGVFTGLPNGNYCMRAISCGDTTAPVCFSGVAPKPAVAATVQISNNACSSFTASITRQENFTAPQYCLFDKLGVQITCNTTGVFDSLAYGSYCIKITDGCYDTTLVRCFTQSKPVPEVAATLQQLNSTCTTFTAKVTGQKSLFNAQYCMYTAANDLVACNSTGVFDNLPYGSYCVVVTDGCTGAAIRVCQTFSYDYTITLSTSKLCTIGSANVNIAFVNGNSPFGIQVFRPDGSLAYSTTATAATQMVLPALTSGGVYTIIGTDACGRKDTATIAPDASEVTKSITAVGKCPSATWLNGSGDLTVEAASNLGIVTPKLIKKDGTTFSKTHSSNSGASYVFSDLQPATYIVEYSIRNCSTKLYDTFALQPYAYPTQGRSAIYQCDNESINLTADVAGGVGPYKYQIIGSEPAAPSIMSVAQSSPAFNINTGVSYSLIRLRTVDACGNATLNDVSVLPLQNIVITADTTCLFTNITLAVDTIPDATYSWYKKRDVNDSVFLTNDKTYNIPMMRQQDIGTYVCKVEMNNSCLTRLAFYDLTGHCGEVYLPVPLTVTGKTAREGNQLRWRLYAAQPVHYFEVERMQYERHLFVAIANVDAGNSVVTSFTFTDTNQRRGTAVYRIKAVLQNGTVNYSNTISLQRDGYTTGVYPNPVRNSFVVSLSGTTPCQYRIELRNLAGQLLYSRDLKNITSVQQRCERPKGLNSGLYLLKITNNTTGASTHYKLLFE